MCSVSQSPLGMARDAHHSHVLTSTILFPYSSLHSQVCCDLPGCENERTGHVCMCSTYAKKPLAATASSC
jgi:hypothetical protein